MQPEVTVKPEPEAKVRGGLDEIEELSEVQEDSKQHSR